MYYLTLLKLILIYRSIVFRLASVEIYNTNTAITMNNFILFHFLTMDIKTQMDTDLTNV